MQAAKLVTMVNQIADFFRAYPEPEAVAGIRDHLKSFWTPRMRQAAAKLAEAGDANLDPLSRKALLGLS